MEASLIAANVAAGCLIAVFAYAGWHTWEVLTGRGVAS